MEIPYTVLLKKIEEKVHEAKQANSDARIREQVQAIKTLCEVILEESSAGSESYVKPLPVQPVNITAQSTVVTSPRTVLGEKKIEMEDGANGDSIFDF